MSQNTKQYTKSNTLTVTPAQVNMSNRGKMLIQKSFDVH